MNNRVAVFGKLVGSHADGVRLDVVLQDLAKKPDWKIAEIWHFIEGGCGPE